MKNLIPLIFTVMLFGGCRSVDENIESSKLLERQANSRRMLQHAKIRLDLDEKDSEDHNPHFTVTVMNTSRDSEIYRSSDDSFILDMYSPPVYAISGNLAVWRNDNKLWEIEPLQLEMLICGFPAVESIQIRPRTGYAFSFQATDRFPIPDISAENKDPETLEETLSFSRVLPPPVNPFRIPGHYKVIYEIKLFDFSNEDNEDLKIFSNVVEFIIKEK